MVQPINDGAATVVLSDLPVLLVLAVGVLVVALASASATWNRTGHLVTLVHEAGHAFSGLVVGRRPRSIVVSRDMSGVTVTAGPRIAHDPHTRAHASLGAFAPRLPLGPRSVLPMARPSLLGSRVSVRAGEVWTAWWGYPAPALVGLGLVAAAVHGWASPALVVLGCAAALVLVLSRSMRTLGLSLLSTVTLLGLWTIAPAGMQVMATYGLGLFLLTGALRLLLALLVVHVRGEREQRLASDAGMLASMTKVPAMLWVLSFAGGIFAAVLFATGAVLTALFA